MDKQTAEEYIRSNFQNDDFVAVVLIQKRSGAVEQRIASTDRVVSDQFQAWLRYKNKEKYEVYLSMNALCGTARGRRKEDVAQIRHVYLDIDENGPGVIQLLKERADLPTPNHVIESSPGRFQCVWRVERFTKEHAETLMRSMVREFGADPAATDCSRVLRVPGFYNHKYGTPYFVTVEELSNEVYVPSHFPNFPAERPSSDRDRELRRRSLTDRESMKGRSQSERDWAYAMRALVRGDEPVHIARAIASHRPDKPNPEYYAEYTVRKAMTVLKRPNNSRLGAEPIQLSGGPSKD